MTEPNKQIADAIRSGSYFLEARQWFQAVYIGPISERSFFLIIALLAAVVAFFSLAGVFRLMPLTNRDPVLVYATDRPDDVYMTLVPLTEKREPVNPAIVEFFVTQYIIAREGYFYQTFASNARFVRAQSDVITYNAYATAYSPNNSASPFASLGEYGQRLVTPRSVRIAPIRDGKGSAEVMFTTEVRGSDNPTITNWTAKMDYVYTELTTEMVDNAQTGDKDLNVRDPQFQVVSYVLQQNP
jgi:type IV secretion system protein VirB8